MLFSASVDLYRFVSGSGAKKRGSGEIKILKNVETGKFRCVMRREQILNVCANFAISPGFEVLSTKMGDNVLSWLCKVSLFYLFFFIISTILGFLRSN